MLVKVLQREGKATGKGKIEPDIEALTLLPA